MRRVTVAVVLMFAAEWAEAQGFWLKKPFHEWTDQELAKLTTDSPWAKRRTLSVEPPGEGARPMSGRGSGTGGGTGRGTGGGGGPRNVLTVKAVITWQSALPMRQATLRSKMTGPGHAPADANSLLDVPLEAYVIVISGLPQDVAQQALSDPARLRTVLKAGKREIGSAKIATRPHGDNLDIVLFFSRSPAISLEDKDAELDVRLGSLAVKAKFKLADMVFGGRLEL